ncbi:MAG: histone deacetylase [Thermoplasmata archaeon]|nr:histone deacetylase [Candidatus Sysuiplasma acidicola]
MNECSDGKRYIFTTTMYCLWPSMTFDTTIFYADEFLSHRHSPGHPESPGRLQAVLTGLSQYGYPDGFLRAAPATITQLCSVHDRSYVEGILQRTLHEVDEETPVYNSTFMIASLSAGAAVSALNSSVERGKQSLALVRPPGHHASSGRGGGFCYFNNVAIARRSQAVRRMAIVDLDVHHGNGTSKIFYDDRSTLYVSTHQKGIYPGTGKLTETGGGEGEWHNINIPLPAGSGDATFDMIFERIIMPVLTEYRPDCVLVSLGADAHYRDPLASMTLSTSGYVRCIGRLASLKRPVSAVLEGGYDLDALTDVVLGTVHTLDGMEYDARFTEVSDTGCTGRAAVEEAARFCSEYWKSI